MIPNNTFFDNLTFSLSTAKIVCSIEAAAAQPLFVSRIKLGNTSNATNQQLNLRIVRITTKGDLAGTAATNAGSPSSNVATQNATVLFDCTETTSVFGEIIDHDGVASLAGYDLNLPEHKWIYVPAAGILALELMVSATAFTCAASIDSHEL